MEISSDKKMRKLSNQSSNILATIGRESFSLSRNASICSIHEYRRRISIAKESNQQVEPQIGGQESKKGRFNKSFHGYRYIVAVMSGLCVGFMMLLRLNITVAIIKMVNQTQIYLEEHPDDADLVEYFGEDYVEEGEFEWNNERQQLIISYYMITYTLPQLFTTKLAVRLGSRYALFGSLLICSLSTLITPVAAYCGWKWVLVLRLIQGLGASAVLPMMLNVIENWMPYSEISIGLTIAQLLQATINAGNPLFVGYLSSYHWRYTFYVTGLIVLVYCVLWLVLITDRPNENWLVSEEELNLICDCTNLSEIDHKSCKKEPDQRELDLNEGSPSIMSVFRVPSFYAYSFIWLFYCSSSGCFTYILPVYLRQFLKIDVTLNGFYCFLIQSGGVIAVIWPHPVLRILQTKCSLSLTSARRVINAVVVVLVAASWIYVGIFHQAQLILLFINRLFHQSNDVVVTGSLMSNFSKSGISSVIFSMVNTFGNLSILFTSALIGYVLDYTGQSEAAWGWIFSLFGVTQILATLAFCTIIRSDPINLKKKKTGNETKTLAGVKVMFENRETGES